MVSCGDSGLCYFSARSVISLQGVLFPLHLQLISRLDLNCELRFLGDNSSLNSDLSFLTELL